MKSGSQNSGFTLIEMVVVVAIIAILISMVFGVANRVEEQGKVRLCKDTLALIDNALEQFRDFGYEYKNTDYAGLTFPLDCNDNNNIPENLLIPTLEKALGLLPLNISITGGVNQYEYCGSEALYFFLCQVPDCRTTLDKIDKSLITDKDKNGNQLKLVISTVPYPLPRFIDPWKTTLRYDYYDESIYPLPPDLTTKKTFPVITSAGPDKKFGTKDDISNRQ